MSRPKATLKDERLMLLFHGVSMRLLSKKAFSSAYNSQRLECNLHVTTEEKTRFWMCARRICCYTLIMSMINCLLRQRSLTRLLP